MQLLKSNREMDSYTDYYYCWVEYDECHQREMTQLSKKEAEEVQKELNEGKRNGFITTSFDEAFYFVI